MNFTSTFNHGFQMTFENGLTISVQWGSGNYCERRSYDYVDDNKTPITESPNAEIAIWKGGGKMGEWLNFGRDTVKGWCSPDEVALWIYKVSSTDSLESLQESINELNQNV